MAKAHLVPSDKVCLGPMRRFTTIGNVEWKNVYECLDRPLSGYIGGNPKGGYWVERLSEEWKEAFSVSHAVPCNSATSGLLAACMAVNIGPGDEVWTTPYSMSATAACAKELGAEVRFIDIEQRRFGIDPLDFHRASTLPGYVSKPPHTCPKAIIVTNLFGHPARLAQIRQWCDKNNVWMIEDNAQAPFAMEDGRYTGTIGHIGVFSLNVHKHIQCGEGGVVVTKDSVLRHSVQCAINHGELDSRHPRLGLNLRMTEPIAAIACAQLAKAKVVIEGRREIALAMNDMVKDIPWIVAHEADEGCKHVYYLWTAVTDTIKQAQLLAAGVQLFSVPIRRRYAPLLNKLFSSGDNCPVAESTDSRMLVFEVCAYDVRERHLKQMSDIIHQVAEEIEDNE